MKISNYEIVQKAETQYAKMESQKVQIEFFEARPAELTAPVELSLSENANNKQVEEPEYLFHLSEEDKAKIKLLEKLITALTGKEFKFNQVVKVKDSDKSSSSGSNGESPIRHNPAPSSSRPAMGLRITSSHEISEQEKLHFSSKGVVQTEDGRTIAFKLNLNMERSYYEKSEAVIQIGERLQDPLVINLDGKGVAFGDDTLELDLTFDGTPEKFAMLAQGSGFLALDKNNDGAIDDGGELFGPRTGSGFQELAEYDSDQNGWIDETDEIFKELKIWHVNQQGVKTLVGLKEAGVGAIFLGHVTSQYQIKEGSQLLAKIRETGTYLRENGGAGVIHEIDLKV